VTNCVLDLQLCESESFEFTALVGPFTAESCGPSAMRYAAYAVITDDAVDDPTELDVVNGTTVSAVAITGCTTSLPATLSVTTVRLEWSQTLQASDGVFCWFR